MSDFVANAVNAEMKNPELTNKRCKTNATCVKMTNQNIVVVLALLVFTKTIMGPVRLI